MNSSYNFRRYLSRFCITNSSYNFQNIRALLTDGFTDQQLRRLCYDAPNFRPVYDDLAQNSGKSEIIDRLIEYADRTLQVGTLLRLAKELNPAQYQRHQPYVQRSLVKRRCKTLIWLGVFLAILASLLFPFRIQIKNFFINNPLFHPTLVSSVVWGGIEWSHNPALPSPDSFQGDLNYTQDKYPDSNWATGIKLSITGSQILIIHGSAARLTDVPRAGPIGSPTNCFLIMTRGPFNSHIDLQTAAVEIHNIDAAANTLHWAAVKVEDMKAANPQTCGQGVDVWIGK